MSQCAFDGLNPLRTERCSPGDHVARGGVGHRWGISGRSGNGSGERHNGLVAARGGQIQGAEVWRFNIRHLGTGRKVLARLNCTEIVEC